MPDLGEVSIRLWPDYVLSIQSVIRAAIESLGADRFKTDFQHMNELSLNRHLYFRIQRELHGRKRRTSGVAPAPPALDARSIPSPDDPERVPREDKVPDLQWQFIDDQVDDPARCGRSYVIECKRLGNPIRSDWLFNVNYVQHGIRRFVIKTHVYGKDDDEGAMVGYVQSMEPGDICRDVNAQLSTMGLPSLPNPRAAPGTDLVSDLCHDLVRDEGRSPFRLRHLWIDVRR